jgi:DNA-directed RNA polymerase specialized sigma subunit
MNAKEYLSQAIWLDQMVDSKLEQMETLKSLAMKVTTSFTKEKISGGSIEKSKMENIIVKVLDLENEINNDIDRLVDLKREIQNLINSMEDINQKLLLELRYLSGKGWDEIAVSMGYDPRTVYRIHGKALKEFEKVKDVSKCQ